MLAFIGCMPVKDWAAQWLRKKGQAGELVILWGSRVLTAALLVICYMELVTGSFNPFIYFQF